MPQFDKRRSLEIPIEFNTVENLTGLPYHDRVTLVLITDGKAVISINGETKTLIAPCVLCLSEKDNVKIIENKRLYAQSFSLNPSYLKNRMTYRTTKNNKIQSDEEPFIDVLNLFFHRDGYYNGILDLPQNIYIKILEWMGVIGTEIAAQSDGRWTCRVRAYFLRILNMLDEIYSSKSIKINKPLSNVDEILAYLHAHYMDEDITLEMLCRQTHTNRTTLNRNFKERTGQTVIAYLLNYRLRVATELLAHTGLTIDEIARASGFIYDTYLIRQFTAKTGQTPTEYRQEARRKYGIVITKN
ncbi:MAG: AraC family transcriptional regulator [Oscillospiraceae bacterium]|nr:AraC family transcriptional regulator [Oscillospiraceae bacterium]